MQPGVLTREAVRELDRRASQEFGVPSIVLMENAGRGAADVLGAFGVAGPVLVACGPGNNGGDGLVIARHLDLRDVEVRVLLAGAPAALRGDAAVNLRIVQRSGIRCDFDLPPDGWPQALAEADWIVDALLGTGSRGEPRPPLDQLIDAINASGRPVLAVDLPSGLDCDLGQPARSTVRAAHTCTFVAPKPGLLAATAAPLVGQLHVVDIGAPRCLVEEMLRGHV